MKYNNKHFRSYFLLSCIFFFFITYSTYSYNYLQELGINKPVNVDSRPKPFDYSHTIFGNIPQFPLTKEVKSGILVDLNSRKVLWAKRPITPVEIASMTKMMSVLLFLKSMQKNPNISLNSLVSVTKDSSMIGGSGVPLKTGQKITIKKLLETVLIHSANASTYLLSLYFSNGNSNAFVKMMNDESKKIGLTAKYYNCDGLPMKNPIYNNKGSAQDMAFLAEKLLKFPLITNITRSKYVTFYINGELKKFRNSNPLVRDDFKGITGMKTGYTNAAGYCLTATCNRNGRILVAVVTGLKHPEDRYTLPKQLLTWGYKGGTPEATRIKKKKGINSKNKNSAS